MPKPAYQRVLLKLSGEALMGDRFYGIDPSVAKQIAQEMIDVRELGVDAVVTAGARGQFDVVADGRMVQAEGR